jgi:single-stranded-DNA-specific exonuclease
VMENIEAFRTRLVAYAQEKLTEELLIPSMELDGVLELGECVPEVIEAMDLLAPFGRGNPKPQFLMERVRLTAPPRRVGATGAHLQLTLSQDCARGMRAGRAICFKMGMLAPQLPVGVELNLVVEPKVVFFNGRAKVDLVVGDLARCGGEAFEVS